MDDYYSILGVTPDSSPGQLRERYRFLRIAYHPDKFQNEVHKAEAEETFKKITRAFDTLSDPALRAEYDFSHNPNNQPVPVIVPVPPPMRRYPPPRNVYHRTHHQPTRSGGGIFLFQFSRLILRGVINGMVVILQLLCMLFTGRMPDNTATRINGTALLILLLITGAFFGAPYFIPGLQSHPSGTTPPFRNSDPKGQVSHSNPPSLTTPLHEDHSSGSRTHQPINPGDYLPTARQFEP